VDARIIKEGKASDREMSQLITRRNALRRRIDKWTDIQDVYMPAITDYRVESMSSDDADRFFEHPEIMPLHLPSNLPTDVISTIPPHFVELETRLCISQADESLHDLKRFLRITMGLWDFKHANIGHSQRPSTRMYSTISTYREKVNRTANRYCIAYQALSTLDPGGGTWSTHLQECKSTDVRPPMHDMDKAPKKKRKKTGANQKDPEASEGRRALSWIWLVGKSRGMESEGDENTEVTQEIGESKPWHACINMLG
jgi:hypothetical protein